ncbi:MAG: hypothetical protein QGH45_19945 [Myxococcota bacterium]|nr:hypothetical protein [Myxococcota bacterium]
MAWTRFSTLLLTVVLAVSTGSAMAQPNDGGPDDGTTSKTLREALTSEAVLIVYGTGADDETVARLKAFAESLGADLQGKMEGDGWPITIRADNEVSLPELGGTALFLVGTARSNVVLALYEGRFPLQLDETGVSVGKERFDGANLATTFAMVNPFNPAHYAVVYTGVNDVAIVNAPEFAFDEIGYVVVDGAGVKARGQFDTTIPEYWTILPGASVKQVTDQLTADATPIEVAFQPTEPLPGTDDKWVFMLGYAPCDGTADQPAFLMPYLTHLHQQRDVRLVAIDAPLWMSEFLEAYVVDGKTPPEELQLPEETAAFVEELRAYNKGLSTDKRVHLATFDLNHDVFGGGGTSSLLPLKTQIGALKDREARKHLSEVMGDVTVAFDGGNPAAMLQAINRLNEAVAIAALKKKIPADVFPALRNYLDAEKASIFYHQPENRARRDTPTLREARSRILRQSMTDVIQRGLTELESPVLLYLDADHANKGAPGPAYGRIPLAQYFDKYYEPTWEKVHVMVTVALDGGYYDADSHSSELIPGKYTPDEFESLVSEFRQPNSMVLVNFTDPFWTENRLTVHHTWTWPAKLYDGMAFFFDVQPATGNRTPLGQ